MIELPLKLKSLLQTAPTMPSQQTLETCAWLLSHITMNPIIFKISDAGSIVMWSKDIHNHPLYEINTDNTITQYIFYKDSPPSVITIDPSPEYLHLFTQSPNTNSVKTHYQP